MGLVREAMHLAPGWYRRTDAREDNGPTGRELGSSASIGPPHAARDRSAHTEPGAVPATRRRGAEAVRSGCITRISPPSDNGRTQVVPPDGRPHSQPRPAGVGCGWPRPGNRHRRAPTTAQRRASPHRRARRPRPAWCRRGRRRQQRRGASRRPPRLHGRVDPARPRAARLDLDDPGRRGHRPRPAGHGRRRTGRRAPPLDHVRPARIAARPARPGRRGLLHVPPAVHRGGDGPRRADGGRLGGVPVHPRAAGAGVPALVRDPREPLRDGHGGRRRRPDRRCSWPGCSMRRPSPAAGESSPRSPGSSCSWWCRPGWPR